jgi:serine/threonine-protein kinase
MLALQGLEPQVPRHAHQLNIAETFLGLPDYMAPEMVLGEPFSASSDIFALGVLLFELLSGRPPFSGETPFDVAEQYLLLPVPSLSALVPALPAGVDAVVRKAVAYSAEQRFQSAGELVRAFEQALQPQQVDGQSSTSLTQNVASAGSFATAGKQSEALIAMLQTSQPGLDPFAWWGSASMTQLASRPHTGSHVSGGRRRAVALLSAGAIVAAGLGGGGLALEHYLQTRQKVAQVAHVQSQNGAQGPSSTLQPTVTTSTQQHAATSTPTLATRPSATAQSLTPTPKPTVAPKATPTSAGSPSSSSKGKGKGKGKGGKKG